VPSSQRHRPRAAPPAAQAPGAPSAGASWPALAILAALAVVLYTRCLLVGFAGDDYVLLDAARRFTLGELLSGRHGIPGFYRPVSRELYFWCWGRVLDLSPWAFHFLNAATWVAAGALYFTFVRRWLGTRTALCALAALALFPPTGALLSWVSCAQDLIALFWCAAALALYQGRRHAAAGLAVALAALSKETAIPLALTLAVWDWLETPGAPARERLRRLMPALLGLAAALAVAIAVRLGWPAGRAIAVWSPGQIAEAWRIPVDLATSFAPPHTLEGIAASWRTLPGALALAAMLALAVPFAAWRSGGAPAPAPRAPAPVPRAPAPRAPAPRSPARAALLFGIAATLLGALPVAVIVERWRGYYFSIAALGTSLIVALLLARLPAWIAGPLLALAAVVNHGSNSVYRPLATGEGPGRHAHANYEFFRGAAVTTAQMLATLEPCCDSLRSVSRAYVEDLPPGVLFDTVIGAALRVTCRDTVERARRIEAFQAAEAGAPLGLLSFDPAQLSFAYRRLSAADRVAIGDHLLATGRPREAAACFAAARSLGDTTAALRRKLEAIRGPGAP
jgi:hypothetical protein